MVFICVPHNDRMDKEIWKTISFSSYFFICSEVINQNNIDLTWLILMWPQGAHDIICWVKNLELIMWTSDICKVTAPRDPWVNIVVISWCLILTHWGRVTHISVGNLTIIGPDNGLSPGRRQAIIRTNAGILLIGPLGTNFSENLIEILIFSFTKMRLKVSSAKWRPFSLSLNALINYERYGLQENHIIVS